MYAGQDPAWCRIEFVQVQLDQRGVHGQRSRVVRFAVYVSELTSVIGAAKVKQDAVAGLPSKIEIMGLERYNPR